jgi:hypothetical protein
VKTRKKDKPRKSKNVAKATRDVASGSEYSERGFGGGKVTDRGKKK